ncbi:hypothetical protein HYPSUDRAFT_48950 [Hypholoma sublateritium FD-334 SS-4]|uniref:Uncharacterized protein n=1 Tax=Hypholoma sublateritium (strain FD-334 SS-4) TaxID=945553 RepID=A0A0D2NDG5_HYPSF|nr:hypothetical protein HYPSUDRAFT_48950 [Hypholoma sublateritium FD-334 SS-4]
MLGCSSLRLSGPPQQCFSFSARFSFFSPSLLPLASFVVFGFFLFLFIYHFAFIPSFPLTLTLYLSSK